MLQGETPFVAAYALLLGIAQQEGKTVINGVVQAERKWLLDTYAECLAAVTGRDQRTTKDAGVSPAWMEQK